MLAVLAVAAIGRHLVVSAQATARGDWVDGSTAVRAAIWHSCPDAAPVGCRSLVA